jgi:hypothetical protein
MLKKSIFVILFLVASGLSVVAINPRWRAELKKNLVGEERKILAKTEGYLKVEGDFLKVFKIRTGADLSLEVYLRTDSAEFVLDQKINLAEKTDGYFTFQGNATNLVLADIDGDGISEIVSATFDDQGVPRLNAFKYDPSINQFTRMEAPPNLEL